MGVARADDMDCPTGATEEEMDCPTGAALIVIDCPTGAALACVDFPGVFAVFFDGFEMIVTGAESNEAQTRPRGASVASLPAAEGGGSAMSSES